MSPKKLKLAKKVTTLVRKRAETIDGKPAEETEIPETASEMNTVPTSKSKLNFASLRAKADGDAKAAERKPSKRPLRAVVDIEMMKRELKQLEDPPVTSEEKLLSYNRLGFEFFDVPSETLAKNLLGKILVRRLENGTLLKGRIVETESYLGGEDKASQTYMNKITPRNSPMYMPPGTIYVYLTYGMYHCFNISSRAPGASVFIRAAEPIVGQSYMELMRNTRWKKGSKEKVIREKSRNLKAHELCNGPSKLCTAFVIDKETFNEKDITKCYGIWIENDESDSDTPFAVIAAPRVGIESAGPRWAAKPLRFYIFENPSENKPAEIPDPIVCFIVFEWEENNIDGCDGSGVLIRALAPIEGTDQMEAFRNSKLSSLNSKKPSKVFKLHELSNGPSKFCIAFGLSKIHTKHSACSWKGLWLEDHVYEEEMKIVSCPRIGIDSAGPEWAMKPLRFYLLGDKSVSKVDKKAEAALC